MLNYGDADLTRTIPDYHNVAVLYRMSCSMDIVFVLSLCNRGLSVKKHDKVVCESICDL